jgi:hypothetical protein
MYPKSTLAAAIAAMVLVLGGSAQAVVIPIPTEAFGWSYTGTLWSGGGTLTIGALDPTNSLNSPPGYDITAITGEWNGNTITGLLAPGTCCSSPANDNILYLSGSYFDLAGMAFGDNIGDQVNIYDPQGVVVIMNQNFGDTGNFTLTATPLPAALPLFASGLGAMGLLGWRRKRKNTTAIAAA